MMMKKLIPGALSILALAALGTFLYSRLQPSLESKEPVFRTVQALSESEMENRLPPVDTEEYPFVNKQRLDQLAGQAYDGPSYAMTQEEFSQLVAESKSNEVSGNRLPANEGPETAKKPAKGKKKKK